MKQQEANLFLLGLNLDTNPIAMSNLLLSYALNATMMTKNGNEMVLQNDMGNGRVESANLPAGYVPVGMKEYGGIVYVASYNPLTHQSLIGSFPSPERNISLKEESDTDIIFGYFSIDDTIVSTTMKVQLTPNVMRPGDKFSIDMSNYKQLESLLKHIDNGSMTLNVAVLNASGGLVKLEYMNNLDLSGVVKYEYTFDKPYYSYIRYYLNRYNEEEIKYNVYKSKIVGELYLTLDLNVPEYVPYEVTAYSYLVENTPLNLRKSGKCGYFDVYLPRPYETDKEIVNLELTFISKYKIKSNLEVYECTTDELTGTVKEVIKWNDEEVIFTAGTTVRVYFTEEDINTENIKTLEITPYFDDPLDLDGSELSNSGWLPMLTKKISVNPAKVGKGEVYLSEFRYYVNVADNYMTLDYAFESYLRKNEYITNITLNLLPYEHILDENYTALDLTSFSERPKTKEAFIGHNYYIPLQLQTNRKNYFGNFQELLNFESLDNIKDLYIDDTVAHNANMHRLNEGYAYFAAGLSYIGYVEITTERHTYYTQIDSPEVRVQRSKPLAIFTCGDINDLYFNSNLTTYMRGDDSNTIHDDRIIVPSSLHIGYRTLHNQSIDTEQISNITYSNEGKEKVLYSYGDMDLSDFDEAALIKVKGTKLYMADYSLSVNPKYNVTDKFPIGIDTKVTFKTSGLQGTMKRNKATVKGNPLYYEFYNSSGDKVLINTAPLELPEVSEISCVLDELHKFAELKTGDGGETLLHINTYELPSIYYGIALRLDDYYVDDVDMLLPFNYDWEEGALLQGCVYGDHYRNNLGKKYSIPLTNAGYNLGIKEGRHYMAGSWIVLEAWRNDSSLKRYGIVFPDKYDASIWQFGGQGTFYDHAYYINLNANEDTFGSYWDGGKSGEQQLYGSGYLTNSYKRENNNKWKVAIDKMAKKAYLDWLTVEPIIYFWLGAPKEDFSVNPRQAINSRLSYAHTTSDNFSNFCIPVMRDSLGNRYAINEWGYASLGLDSSGKSTAKMWKETYLDLLYRTFGHIFGKQEHITENVLFKKVTDDNYDTYTNPYTCNVSLLLDSTIEIITTHYDNNNRAYSIEFENDLVIVKRINEISFNNYEHPMLMPEVAIQDTETNKLYTKGEKTFTLSSLNFLSHNFESMAGKFYDFEPGKYTLLKDNNQFYTFSRSDVASSNKQQLLNVQLLYFKGADGLYYSINTEDISNILYGRTILLELKNEILSYKRDALTGWYGLQLGRMHQLIIGGRGNLGDGEGTTSSGSTKLNYCYGCNYGLLNSLTSYSCSTGNDDIGRTSANFSSYPNMVYLSNARLLDDFDYIEDPKRSEFSMHYIYDYYTANSIPSLAYFVDDTIGNIHSIAVDVYKKFVAENGPYVSSSGISFSPIATVPAGDTINNSTIGGSTTGGDTNTEDTGSGSGGGISSAGDGSDLEERN